MNYLTVLNDRDIVSGVSLSHCLVLILLDERRSLNTFYRDKLLIQMEKAVLFNILHLF